MTGLCKGRYPVRMRSTIHALFRALQAGALAVGAKVRIETLPGYLPLANDPALGSLYKDNAASLIGADEVREVVGRIEPSLDSAEWVQKNLVSIPDFRIDRLEYRAGSRRYEFLREEGETPR